MNYYEELGIPSTAPAEEVRGAYRNLARLLHPDQQSDETLRRLAGIQMARLNAILETLTDPKLRAEYDGSLRREAREAAAAGERMYRAARELDGPFREGLHWSRFAWPAAGVLGIGLFVLFLAQDAAVQRPAGDGEGIAAGGQEGKESGAWPVRTEGRYAVPDRKEAGGSGKSDTSTPAFSGSGKAHRLRSSGNRRKLVPGGGEDSGRTDGAPAVQFGGEWYYAKPAKLADPDGMCPPVYIDMEIAESTGKVTGKYSARYVVGDRSISPFVEFQFAGAVREPVADLEWRAPGGAAGRVQLTLLSARSVRVEWSADRVGTEMGFAAGKATLVRRGSP